MPPVTVAAAAPDQQAAALRLAFGHLPDADRDGRVANALAMLQAGELDPAGLLVARTGGGPVGAMLCQPMPGANGLLWPPRAAPGAPAGAVTDALVRHAAGWLRSLGVKLAQAFVPEADEPLTAPLARNGFPHVTDLWHLRHDLESAVISQQSLVNSSGTANLRWLTYPECDPGLFHRTLLASYEETLDCPEISGVRTLEEVLAGLRTDGHDPSRWWLLEWAGAAAGVLILSAPVGAAAWDLAYLGVVPAMRGRGCGRALVAQALRAARAGGADALTLFVDHRNAPARRLYADAGFRACDRWKVFLAVWRD
jgi:ribosomal protein S18 acetylase RimI-like enzyme